MAKTEDKILKDTPDFQIVEFQAKKGKGTCKQYKSLDAAKKDCGEKNCLRDVNRQIRTDAINGVNRELSDIARLKKAMKDNPKIAEKIQAILNGK